MRISTLICVYLPKEELLASFRDAVRSVRCQSRTPDEIVIVLDEPMDWIKDEVTIDVDTFSKIDEGEIDWKLFVRPKKEGLAAAKNFGLQHCTGDYVTYCDADDKWMLCKLEVQEKFAQENPWVHVIGTLAWDCESDSVLRPNCFAPGQYEKHADIRFRLPHENVMCHGSVMINREQLMRFEGPYRDVRGAEDWDLWRRMMSGCCIFHNIPERLYVYSLGTSVER